MSQRALLLATRDTIKLLTINGSNPTQQFCEVNFDGSPPPTCGAYFIAVHPGSWENANEAGTCLDEKYGIDLTVTVRATVQPRDRLGPNVLAGAGGQALDKILELLRAGVSGNYALLALANNGQPYSIGGSASGFIEPLWFKSADTPQPRGPDWFLADDDIDQTVLPPTGISQTLHFGEANRVQDIASQT